MLGNSEKPVEAASSDLSLQAKWFAAYTASRHEKHVFDLLTDRQVESFLPLYKTRRQWSKRTPVTLEIPLFLNYVFVRITGAQRTAVLRTPGVFSIVGGGKEPWELPEREIEALRRGIQTRTAEPHPYLVLGDRVCIRSGVFAGLEGIILCKKNKLRIILTLDQIMRSISVELNAEELEPLSHPRPILS